MKGFWVRIVIFLSFLLSTIYYLLSTPLALAQNDDRLKQSQEYEQKIQEYEQKLKELAGQKQTLSNAIAYLNTQIGLTQTKIAQTEQTLVVLAADIDDLVVRIDRLNTSLDTLSTILIERVRKSYKQERIEPLYLFFASTGFTDFVNQVKYIRAAQLHDRELLLAMERTRSTYDIQKQELVRKQDEVEALNATLKKQKASLAIQQQEKQRFLEVTKNDEKKFQQLLADAQAELAAIQSAIAGKGVETEVGPIHDGDTIASIISGKSVCSTGAHVHLEIIKNGARQNPADYLRSTDVDWDLCGWFGCDEPFNFSGSLNWPVNPRIRITQGYGMTAYAKKGAYRGGPHTGIDITSTDNSIKTIQSGILFRGSYEVKSGCEITGFLRYVKVKHDDGLETYYFHVNYI